MDNALIRRLGRFVRLASEDKQLLSHVSGERVRRFEQREDIVHENARPEAMVLVLSGWAARYKTLEDGRRQIITLLLPGDLCDLNVFVLRRMDHTISTLTSATVAEISRTGYEALMLSSPRLREAMWWGNLVTTAIQREWAMNLGQRDAAERMAHLFCELFYRLKAVDLTVGNVCALPLTQAELGEATGLSSVHVNRTLRGLKAAKLIMLRGKILTIPDIEALERAALFNRNYLHLDREGAHLDANE
ncbi:MAG: Crp/Fnr family transcriptional regulator [Methylobacterium mesophilicum]|nr:Crp/Fnr family transcriptional regulator [Methylobacterium mesophilicum]